MATSWGPVEHPMEHFDDHAPGATDGSVVQPHVKGGSAPNHDENYDATDGRHNRADHQGWASVDPLSGPTADTDFATHAGRFPDGPGPWRQT